LQARESPCLRILQVNRNLARCKVSVAMIPHAGVGHVDDLGLASSLSANESTVGKLGAVSSF
jgi:hypothetical protein